MKHSRIPVSSQQAAEALCALLEQLSFIRRHEIQVDAAPRDQRIGLQVRVNVLGRQHTLACALHRNGFTEGFEAALYDVHSAAAGLGCAALPVIICSSLTPEAQTLCRKNHIAYLDLDGNAYLDVGEIFIARRAIFPMRKPTVSADAKLQSSSMRVSSHSVQPGSISCA